MKSDLTGINLQNLSAPDDGYVIYYDAEGTGNVPGLGYRITKKGARAWILNYARLDHTTKRRRARIGPGSMTLRAARKEAGRWKAQLLATEPADPLIARKHRKAAPIFAELADEWLEAKARPFKRPSSLKNDQLNLAKHLLPRFAQMKPGSISKARVEKMMAELKPTPVMANRCKTLLSTILTYAEEQGYCEGNPCYKTVTYHEDPRDLDPLTPLQLGRLYTALANYPDRQATKAIKLIAWTGCRMSEALRAEWSEFNLEAATWRRTAKKNKQKVASLTHLNELVVNLLRDLRTISGDSDYLFPSPRRAGSVTTVRRCWRIVRREAGLGSFHLHDLRHNFAQILLDNGVAPKIITKMLNHGTSRMVDHYAKVREPALQEAAAIAGTVLAPASLVAK